MFIVSPESWNALDVKLLNSIIYVYTLKILFICSSHVTDNFQK